LGRLRVNFCTIAATTPSSFLYVNNSLFTLNPNCFNLDFGTPTPQPSTLKTSANYANSGDEQVASITCSPLRCALGGMRELSSELLFPLRSAPGRTRSSNRCPFGALLNSRIRQRSVERHGAGTGRARGCWDGSTGALQAGRREPGPREGFPDGCSDSANRAGIALTGTLFTGGLHG
jgi:hypothetical protein